MNNFDMRAVPGFVVADPNEPINPPILARDNPLLKKLNIAVAVVAATAIIYLALSLAQMYGAGLPPGLFFNVSEKYVGIGSAVLFDVAAISKFVLYWQKNRQEVNEHWGRVLAGPDHVSSPPPPTERSSSRRTSSDAWI